MDRRKSLKVLALTSVSGGLLLDACKPKEKAAPAAATAPDNPLPYDRMQEEVQAYKAIKEDTFFTPHEMATIGILSDIIIPKDEISGSATDAEVPAFIAFIVKDMPQHQVPMRGGLRWLDLQSNKMFGKPFTDASAPQRIQLIDQIAYPEKAAQEMTQGVAFFNLMRNLTATGFFTSKMGIADMGYVGNKPNQWNGVPDDVLKQYGIAYTDKELRECVSFDKKV